MIVQLPGPHATAWHFFELATDLLVGNGPSGDRDGLALYADHPELQFGPVSILFAAPFTILGPVAGKYAAMGVVSVFGLVVVRLLADVVPIRSTPAGVAAAIAIVITWGDIAVRTAHVDDAIALVAIVAALRWVVHDRATAATAMFALAAAAKPWAVVFVPLAALPLQPGSWRRPVIAAGAAVATWLPFIVSEPDTLGTSGFEIVNDPTSSLRALGIDAATTPDWIRPVQLVGGLAIVAALVMWDRWPGAILAGITWRLILDPGVHRYYTAGFVLGALLVELRSRPNRIPWFTIVGAGVLELTAVPDVPVGPAQIARLAVLLAALAAAALDRGLRSAVLTPMRTG